MGGRPKRDSGKPDVENALDNIQEGGKPSFRWKTAVYDMRRIIYICCCGEEAWSKTTSVFAGKAEAQVDSGWRKLSPERLVALQRQIDDTRARRRLERWVKWVIAIYLVFVIALASFSRVYADYYSPTHTELLSDTTLIALLTTTTVNVIGLGFIVLRGHFRQDGQEEHGKRLDGRKDKSLKRKRRKRRTAH